MERKQSSVMSKAVVSLKRELRSKRGIHEGDLAAETEELIKIEESFDLKEEEHVDEGQVEK